MAQETTKVLLGRVKQGVGTYADGENLYLSKHNWDCGWYWGFGYIGNSRSHFHFESLFYINGKHPTASELFEESVFTDKDWWVIRDLFKQAYGLQAAAEVYRHGGWQTTEKGITDIIQNSEKARVLNEDLKKVLDAVWALILNRIENPVTVAA